MTHTIIVMGVSGSGKTTVGEALADALDATFFDGDDFHPVENVAKMRNSIPLDDADRQPWLKRLRDLIHDHIARDESVIVACSALKQRYRDTLREGNDGLKFIYLKGDFDLIWARMQTREDHYMKADMLQSQFNALEEPSDSEATAVTIETSAPEIAEQVVSLLNHQASNK